LHIIENISYPLIETTATEETRFPIQHRSSELTLNQKKGLYWWEGKVLFTMPASSERQYLISNLSNIVPKKLEHRV
jgi:hypothetical protein